MNHYAQPYSTFIVDYLSRQQERAITKEKRRRIIDKTLSLLLLVFTVLLGVALLLFCGSYIIKFI